jgi:hypothetical protein
MGRAAVSKHLHVLAAAGIIQESHQGPEHVWAVNLRRLEEGRRCLHLVAARLDRRPGRLKRHLKQD